MGAITPCLWFDGHAEQAAEMYTSVVRNSRIASVSRAGDGPDAPAVTVSFELDGQPFVALNGGPQYTFTEAVSFQIACKDRRRIGEPVRLAEGPVRTVLADHPGCVARHHRRRRR
jgi:predicted 3-demethylubiquinone-9 3-methyltransferase (glyoxalase superfamily)